MRGIGAQHCCTVLTVQCYTCKACPIPQETGQTKAVLPRIVRGSRRGTYEGGGSGAEAGEGEQAVAHLLHADQDVALGVQEGRDHAQAGALQHLHVDGHALRVALHGPHLRAARRAPHKAEQCQSALPIPGHVCTQARWLTTGTYRIPAAAIRQLEAYLAWNCSPRSSWWDEGEKRSASRRMAELACAFVRTRSLSLRALPSTRVSRLSFSSCRPDFDALHQARHQCLDWCYAHGPCRRSR